MLICGQYLHRGLLQEFEVRERWVFVSSLLVFNLVLTNMSRRFLFLRRPNINFPSCRERVVQDLRRRSQLVVITSFRMFPDGLYLLMG